MVSDVLPFEQMKLRMLNGSHSFLAYLGYLAGYQHINDCMEDEHYKTAAHRLMLKEQAPTLSVEGVDLNAYADATYQLQLLSEAFTAGSGRSVAATARVLVSP